MTEELFVPRDATILMVDDNPANIKLLADMLTSRGYKVQQATNGLDALDIARATPPDIILLDIFMPHVDGYEVCRRLKVDERTQDIPVIFISALTDVDNIVRGFDVGGSDYITKPFKFKEVLARIANMLMLVHQRRQIELLREQERQNFEALDAMKNEFISMATHDLRNPLNVILGYLRVVQQLDVAEKDAPLLREATENITLSVEKMRTLVTDILDLAQIKTGLDLDRTPISLNSFLTTSLKGLHMVARDKGVRLDYTVPEEDAFVLLDIKRMSRVIDNLVSNAIKYTPQGGQVLVSAQKQNSSAAINVTDNGLGIPENDLPHVFDAFYRIDRGEVQREEGSGLGLSIVKTIVEQHGGTIEVKSAEGQGSTFIVLLPLVEPEPTSVQLTEDSA